MSFFSPLTIIVSKLLNAKNYLRTDRFLLCLFCWLIKVSIDIFIEMCNVL